MVQVYKRNITMPIVDIRLPISNYYWFNYFEWSFHNAKCLPPSINYHNIFLCLNQTLNPYILLIHLFFIYSSYNQSIIIWSAKSSDHWSSFLCVIFFSVLKAILNITNGNRLPWQLIDFYFIKKFFGKQKKIEKILKV